MIEPELYIPSYYYVIVSYIAMLLQAETEAASIVVICPLSIFRKLCSLYNCSNGTLHRKFTFSEYVLQRKLELELNIS